MNKISIIECDTYDYKQVYKGVKEAIVQIGFELPNDKSVLIKPNLMAQNKPEQHTITHYTVIDAICSLLKAHNNKIFIGDATAFYQRGMTQKAFEMAGFKKVADKYGATLVAFEETKLVKIDRNHADIQELDEIIVPKILLEVDMIINACKLKTHSSMRFSGAVKNMFGCLPGGYKQKIHCWAEDEFGLANSIVDVHKVVKPTLSIMDAIISLDGGPTALGKPVKTRVILASENPLALDVVAARMIGYDVEGIPLLLKARERGILTDFNDIEVIGIKKSFNFAKLVMEDQEKPYDNSSIFVTHTYVHMKVNHSKCHLCNKCIQACPVNAISKADAHSEKGKKVSHIRIDKEQCINCYYCMSVCPYKAIKVQSSTINKLGRVAGKMMGI